MPHSARTPASQTEDRSATHTCKPRFGQITIADGLPVRLRPLLGSWLREKGRLGCVHCVRCESWWRRGELPWIDLEPLRAGGPQAMSLEERFTISRFDTKDGLLETILARVYDG